MSHFLSYTLARMRQEDEDLIFRNYTSDVLRGICVSLGGKVEKRFSDIIQPGVVETRTAEEIKTMMKNKIGGLRK